MKLIQCKFFNEELPQLKEAPYPGELGKKIHQEISQKAWDLWLDEQTKLINEYRLNVIDPESIQIIENKMYSFLFKKRDTQTPSTNEKEGKE